MHFPVFKFGLILSHTVMHVWFWVITNLTFNYKTSELTKTHSEYFRLTFKPMTPVCNSCLNWQSLTLISRALMWKYTLSVLLHKTIFTEAPRHTLRCAKLQRTVDIITCDGTSSTTFLILHPCRACPIWTIIEEEHITWEVYIPREVWGSGKGSSGIEKWRDNEGKKLTLISWTQICLDTHRLILQHKTVFTEAARHTLLSAELWRAVDIITCDGTSSATFLILHPCRACPIWTIIEEEHITWEVYIPREVWGSGKGSSGIEKWRDNQWRIQDFDKGGFISARMYTHQEYSMYAARRFSRCS